MYTEEQVEKYARQTLLKKLVWNEERDAELFKDIKCDMVTCQMLAQYYGRYNEVFTASPIFIKYTVKLCDLHTPMNAVRKISYINGHDLICMKCDHKWRAGLANFILPIMCSSCHSWSWKSK
jgi:hypothetical protein